MRLIALLSLAAGLALSSPARGAEVPVLSESSADREHRDDESAGPAPAPAPEARPAPAPAAPAPAEATKKAPEPAPAKPAAGKDYVPANMSLVLDLGGAVNLLGGYAYPKIPIKGSADNGFYWHGLGAGAKLHYNFVAEDLDWRLGLDGTLPGFAAFEATVGVRKDLAPWTNPRVIARGGGGVEMMFGAGMPDVSFLLPVFVGRGEAALEATVIENALSLGLGFELAVKYSVPAGVGFDAGAFVRTEVWF